jgi:membrane fusion protein (multidrug efflux system)
VDVRAQVSGILKQQFFKDGDVVKKGQQLYLIDPEPFEIALRKAQASLAQADSDFKRAEREYTRMKALRQENAVSEKDHDDSLTAFEKAKANYDVIAATVDDARRQLNYTRVFSPSSGIARESKYSIGNLISTAGEASFLVNVVEIDPLSIDFSLTGGQWNAIQKNRASGRVQTGTIEVEIILANGTPYPTKGKMAFVDVVEDPKTGTIALSAEVPNKDQKRTMLPGQFVTAVIKGITVKDAVIVPQSAVMTTAQGSIVFVVDAEGKAAIRLVKVVNYKDFAVVEGLQGGETVVSSGVIKVKPDAAVKTEMKDFDISAIVPPAAAGKAK